MLGSLTTRLENESDKCSVLQRRAEELEVQLQESKDALAIATSVQDNEINQLQAQKEKINE